MSRPGSFCYRPGRAPLGAVFPNGGWAGPLKGQGASWATEKHSLEPGPGQKLIREIDRKAEVVVTNLIGTVIDWGPRYSGVRGKEDGDR